MPRKTSDDFAEIEDAYVSAANLAKIFQIDVSRVNQLVADGTLTRTDKKFHLIDAVQAYTTRLRDNAAGKRGVVEQQTDDDNFEVIDSAFETARLRRNQADWLDIKIASARKLVLPLEAIIEIWARVVAATRTRVLALPTTIAAAVPHLTADDKSAIETIVRDILDDLEESGRTAPDQVSESALNGKFDD